MEAKTAMLLMAAKVFALLGVALWIVTLASLFVGLAATFGFTDYSQGTMFTVSLCAGVGTLIAHAAAFGFSLAAMRSEF